MTLCISKHKKLKYATTYLSEHVIFFGNRFRESFLCNVLLIPTYQRIKILSMLCRSWHCLYKPWGSCSVDEDSSLVGYDAVSLVICSHCFLACLTLEDEGTMIFLNTMNNSSNGTVSCPRWLLSSALSFPTFDQRENAMQLEIFILVVLVILVINQLNTQNLVL
jgi:hypothetical protein